VDVVRILVEVILLGLIVVALASLARRWTALHRVVNPSLATAAQAPPEALWRAIHVGNEQNQTEVLVVLQVPGGADVWDRRICAVIDNQDLDYDKRLYNAMEDARSRATLLNSMRDP
jgi:hypothetical protein